MVPMPVAHFTCTRLSETDTCTGKHLMVVTCPELAVAAGVACCAGLADAVEAFVKPTRTMAAAIAVKSKRLVVIKREVRNMEFLLLNKEHSLSGEKQILFHVKIRSGFGQAVIFGGFGAVLWPFHHAPDHFQFFLSQVNRAFAAAKGLREGNRLEAHACHVEDRHF